MASDPVEKLRVQPKHPVKLKDATTCKGCLARNGELNNCRLRFRIKRVEMPPLGGAFAHLKVYTTEPDEPCYKPKTRAEFWQAHDLRMAEGKPVTGIW